jgi:hypothetical protein
VVGVISREISVFFMARIRQHSFQPFQGHRTEVVLFLMYTSIMQMRELHELPKEGPRSEGIDLPDWHALDLPKMKPTVWRHGLVRCLGGFVCVIPGVSSSRAR